MKILMVGQFYNGSLCSSYCIAFKQLGCEVLAFDDVKEYSNISALNRQRYINKLLEMYFTKAMNEKLTNVAKNFSPDLCLIMKGQRLLPEAILKIKIETKAILFNINADDPFNRNRGASSDSVRRSLKIFDCYFIWSKDLVEKLNDLGLRRIEYLPFGFSPEIHHPPDVSSEENSVYRHDLLFIGNWEKRREKWLGHLKDYDLAIWGADYWKTRCRDRAVITKWQGRELYAEEMSNALQSSKISLNILREQNLGSINMRTFEAAACGAFVLAERSSEAKGFFEEDKEAVYFSTVEELKKKILYYLAHEEERREISRAAYQRCISSNYTYLERAKFLLGIYNKYFSHRRTMRRYRLGFIITHPIQYRVPLYQKINNHPQMDLTVYFCSDLGLRERYCADFRCKLKWDILDLKGIQYHILRNYLPFLFYRDIFGFFNLGIVKEIIRNKYDVVFIPGYGVFSYLLAFWVSSFMHTPIIFSGEPRFPPVPSFFIKRRFKDTLLSFLFSKVRAFGYIGKRAKDFYRFYGVADDKLFFTPYCVDNDFLVKEAQNLLPKKEKLKENLGLPLEYPVILYLSKINANKRPFDLVEAYRNLKAPASLVFVGDGPLYQKLNRYIRKKSIKNVFFFGFQNYSQVTQYYSISDIFVLPSAGESWGIVINEAMCFGLPIITTNKVMAAQDLVRDGENGYILSAGDIPALTNALKDLLNNPEKRKKMGDKSLQIISNWNYDLCIEGFLKALDSIYKR